MGWTGMGRTEVVPRSPTINFVRSCALKLVCSVCQPIYFRIGWRSASSAIMVLCSIVSAPNTPLR